MCAHLNTPRSVRVRDHTGVYPDQSDSQTIIECVEIRRLAYEGPLGICKQGKYDGCAGHLCDQ